MKLVIVAALLVGCTQSENLGDRFSLHAARWSVSAGAPGGANASLVAIDPGGDVIAAGTATSTYWVAKRSGIDGSEQWTQALSGTNFAVTALAVDGDRDVIIGGGYTANQAIGGEVLHTPQQDAYVAMLGPDGTVKWAAGLAPYSQAFTDSIAIAGDRIYVTASSPVPQGASFAAAYALDGTQLWHISLPAKVRAHATADGRVVLAGVAVTSTSLGGTQIDLTREPDLFTATLTRDGAVVGVETFGTFGIAHRDVYATIAANGDLAATANEMVLETGVPADMRVAGDGTTRWELSANDPAQSWAIAAVGDVTVTAGHVTGRLFDAGNGEQVGAMYLAARDATGALVDARVFGDPSLAHGGSAFTALATGPSGELAFAGYVDQPIDFGTGQLAGPAMPGETNLVLGVLDPP